MMRGLASRWGGAVLLALAVSASTGAARAEVSAEDRDFAASYVTATESPTSFVSLERYAGHPLFSWLEAQVLENALARSPDDLIAAAEADAYLALVDEAPHAVDLRRLLLQRAARLGHVADLERLWRDRAATPELRCQRYAQWMSAINTDSALSAKLVDELGPWWAEAKALPAPCDRPIAWLQSQPAGARYAQQRLRARLLDGDTQRATPLINTLPNAEPWRRWSSLLQGKPSGVLQLADGDAASLPDDALPDLWQRYARKDVDGALAALDGFIARHDLPALTAGRLRAETAQVLSWSRRPEAFALFKQVPAAALSDSTHEWRARVALWNLDAERAAVWIDEMPEALRNSQRWRYWRGRALQLSGRSQDARVLLEPLSQEFDSFGMFAAAALQRGYVPRPRSPLSPKLWSEVAQNPAVQRAQLAYRLGLGRVANAEWSAAQRSLSPAARPGLLRVAAELGWYAQAITTGTVIKVFDDMVHQYPRPWLDDVTAAAAASGTPAEWIYSVMRRESAFRPDARSGADALGLLQLLPSTANAVAKRRGLPKPSRADLLSPSRNIPLGAHHLAELQARYNGNWLFTLAAYNAGPNRIPGWLPQADWPGTLPADIWVENIPFNETRGYLQRILMHAAVYQYEATGAPVDVNAWLPPISPRTP